MLRKLIRYGALAGAVVLGACDLAVQNPNQPETERVLATPKDVESLLSSYYLRWHAGMYTGTGNVWGMMAVLSFEDFSSLANNGMGSVISIPRGAIDNKIGNTNAGEQSRIYNVENEVTRIASNALARFKSPTFTLGTPAQDARLKAFAEFLRGVSLGYTALVYDSSAVITPDLDTQDPGALFGYVQVMDSALAALQRAIDIATAPTTGSNGFPLPATWIPGPTQMTAAEFVKLVRSYRARLRANVARTPAGRAAVNWDLVIADAQNGITADHINTTNTTTGPFKSWVSQFMSFSTWHQMTPFVIGMADVSGGYATWIGTPLAGRTADNNPFLIITPDTRFPQGATRAAQQTDLAIPCAPPCKGRYFVNRPTGSDQFAGASWGWSNYDHIRYHDWAITKGRNGDIVFISKSEMNLLQAEGLYRKGDYAGAAALANISRVANGLPAITAFDATSPVPGAANCVPKVPVGPSYTTIACGNLLEAIKYEKRIETAYTHFAAWFLDMRGWGDLPEGTGLHWAPPYQDLQARGRSGAAIYSTGGQTGNAVAAKGTYGW